VRRENSEALTRARGSYIFSESGDARAPVEVTGGAGEFYDREKSQVEEFGFVQSMAPGNTTSMAAVRKGKKNLLVVVFDEGAA